MKCTITPWEKLWSETVENGFTKTDAMLAEIVKLRAFKEQVEKQEPVAWQLNFVDESGVAIREVFYSNKHLQEHVLHNTKIRGLTCHVTALCAIPLSTVNSKLADFRNELKRFATFHKNGLIGPLHPYSWESLARVSIDIATAALSNAQAAKHD